MNNKISEEKSMDFKELALKRESCRAYDSGKTVDREVLEEILATATTSPSACNSQPWKFVACDGEVAQQMPSCIIKEGLAINTWTVDVPAFIIVCETKAKLMSGLECDSQFYAPMDIGMAIATLCYAARDKGLGSCIIGVFDEEKLKSILNIPEDIVIRAIITLGHPAADGTRDKRRKPAEEVISYNSWNN